MTGAIVYIHLCDIFPSVKSLMRHERFFSSFSPLTDTIFVTPIQLFCEKSITKTTFPHNYINDFRIIWIDFILWWFSFVFHTFRTTNDNPSLNINYNFYCSSKIFLKQQKPNNMVTMYPNRKNKKMNNKNKL